MIVAYDAPKDYPKRYLLGGVEAMNDEKLEPLILTYTWQKNIVKLAQVI